MNDFYLVWRDGGSVPTYQHRDFTSAQREAERLCRLHGGKFHVLRRAATCERVDVAWNISEAEQIDEMPEMSF